MRFYFIYYGNGKYTSYQNQIKVDSMDLNPVIWINKTKEINLKHQPPRFW